MESEKIVRTGYDTIGDTHVSYYPKVQQKKLVGLKKLIGLIPKRAYILDAGCGAGIPVAKFLTDKGYKIYGVNLSSTMIKQAKKHVPKAKFKRMSLYEINFPSSHFDAIVCSFVILHLEKKKVQKIFKTFNKILKNKGYFLFSVVKGKTQQYENLMGQKMLFSLFEKKEINEILKKTNFRMIWQQDYHVKEKDINETQMYYLVQKQKTR